MEKIKTFFKRHGAYIVIGVMILAYLLPSKCSFQEKTSKLQKCNELQAELEDQLTQQSKEIVKLGEENQLLKLQLKNNPSRIQPRVIRDSQAIFIDRIIYKDTSSQEPQQVTSLLKTIQDLRSIIENKNRFQLKMEETINEMQKGLDRYSSTVDKRGTIFFTKFSKKLDYSYTIKGELIGKETFELFDMTTEEKDFPKERTNYIGLENYIYQNRNDFDYLVGIRFSKDIGNLFRFSLSGAFSTLKGERGLITNLGAGFRF